MKVNDMSALPEYSAFIKAGIRGKFNFSGILISCIMLLVFAIIVPYTICMNSGANRIEIGTATKAFPATMEMGAELVAETVGDTASAQTLTAALGKVKLSENAVCAVIDGKGAMVAGKDTGASAEQLLAAAAGASGAEAVKLAGEKSIIAYAPIGDTGYTLVATAPQSDFASAQAHKAVTIFIIILDLWGIIFGIFGLQASLPKLRNPLHKLLPEIDRISDGDFSGEVPEIGSTYKEFLQLHDSVYILKQNTNAVISDISFVLGEMAQGNFIVQSRSPESYVGDYKSILEAEELIRDQLSNTLTEINDVSEQVSSGSEQVSNGAQTLAQGATEQASSVEELSATTADVAIQIKDSAEFAEQASVLTKESGEIMNGTMQAMGEAKAAMDEISETSNNISKVIKAIDDIAFQTNILALNAAVEAARAGAAGKGFAVVADEVRNLSQKSAEAAKNTTVLIESSIEAVNKGNKLVDKATSDFSVVVEKSSKINEIVNTISEQFRQQAIAANQISQGIEQVASVIQMNSATSEESAAASQELSGQANILKDLVSQFKLDDGLL